MKTTGNQQLTVQKKPSNLAEWLDTRKDAIQSIIPAQTVNIDRFMQSAKLAIYNPKTPLLERCTPDSIYRSLKEAASYGLELGGVLGQAYLIPYNESYKAADGTWQKKMTCHFQMGYKGLITLARRSKTIKTISTEEVRANDTFEVQLGCGRKLVHSFDLTKERGEVIGYYCLVELENDGIQFAVMTKKQVEEHRNKFSKNYKSEDKENNWNKNFDAMAKKTCVIQALKLCPISIEALEAVRAEEISEIEGVSHADVKNGIYAEDIEYSVVDEVVDEVVEEPAKERVIEMAKKIVNKQPVYNKPEIQTPEISDEELAAMERAFETSGPFDGDIF